MSFVLGLTGSIGMGKSTTAGFFRDAGVPVWDADAAVHGLYAAGGAAADALAPVFPAAVNSDGSVDRGRLRALLAKDPSLIDTLNALVHPIVAQDRQMFLDRHQTAPLVVVDVPLLFETKGDAYCDATLVVTADPEVQRSRVLARGMSEADFTMILSRQMPDAEKRARADHVIETRTPEQTRTDVLALIAQLQKDHRHA